MDKELAFTHFLLNNYASFVQFYGFNPTNFNLDIFVLRDISKRYFKDIDRLQRYHGITIINASKVAGYLTHWISKLKPISLTNPHVYSTSSAFCLYINELFALRIATGWIVSCSDLKNIRVNESFLASFLYLLKYRTTTGDNLAMIYALFMAQRST